MSQYSDFDQKNAAQILASALEQGGFSLAVSPMFDPGKVGRVAMQYKVGTIIDLSVDSGLQEVLAANGLSVLRIAADQRGTSYAEEFGSGRQVMLIKLFGTEDHPETVPVREDLEYYRVPQFVGSFLSNAFATSTVIFVEVNPRIPTVAEALLGTIRNLSRMSRYHILLLRQSVQKEMGEDFSWQAGIWRSSYNVWTLVVPDGAGMRLLLEGK